jgi:hypothetical protein
MLTSEERNPAIAGLCASEGRPYRHPFRLRQVK